VAEEDFDDYDEADDDDGKGGSKALTRKLEELKREALERFDTMRAAVREAAQDLRQGRLRHARLCQDAEAAHRKLMTIRFTAKAIEKLCGTVRSQVDERAQEGARTAPHHRGQVRHAAGKFKDFPPNLLNLKWVEKQAAAGKPWSVVMGATSRRSRNCSSS
jgi:RNA polymerase primary sigma factor